MEIIDTASPRSAKNSCATSPGGSIVDVHDGSRSPLDPVQLVVALLHGTKTLASPSDATRLLEVLNNPFHVNALSCILLADLEGMTSEDDELVESERR